MLAIQILCLDYCEFVVCLFVFGGKQTKKPQTTTQQQRKPHETQPKSAGNSSVLRTGPWGPRALLLILCEPRSHKRENV